MRTGLVMIKTICFGVETPQIRLQLKVKMKGLETQVIRAGAKSQPVKSLLLVGLEVKRGKAGVREKSQVRDDKVVGIQTQGLNVSPLLLFLNLHCCHGKPERDKFLRNL